MKVIIAGSRDVEEKDAIKYIDAAIAESGWLYEINEIVHGNARGIDKAAGKYFKDKLPIKVFPADWDKYGKSAGYIRNKQMAEYADALIAIWNQKSRGTKNMIDIAKDLKLKIFIYTI